LFRPGQKKRRKDKREGGHCQWVELASNVWCQAIDVVHGKKIKERAQASPGRIYRRRSYALLAWAGLGLARLGRALLVIMSDAKGKSTKKQTEVLGKGTRIMPIDWGAARP
jgi:hypothetical protein